MLRNTAAVRTLLYGLVFFAGFANLATEIIAPRLIASLYGSTTVIWAIIISVTLIGISVGYFIGGRVPQRLILHYLPAILILNAIWLIGVSWLIWSVPADFVSSGYVPIGVISFVAFFPPAVLFSMVSPLVISLLSTFCPAETLPKEVGNIYAIGTLGSVLGALVAAFLLIPWVGLSVSLKLFAIGSVLFAMVYLSPRLRVPGLVLLLALALVPEPGHHALREESGAILVAQREGYYQTIRVYTDQTTYIRMDLGPMFHAKMSLANHEPMYGYAVEMVKLAGDVQGKRILIIGGAGHTQARALEKRGALVTEVEIDPFVVWASDVYFGKINGQVIATDGRAYLEGLKGETFDFIFVDAFDGLATTPVQLTTREFFEAASRALAPGGRLIYNFIGVPAGPGSNSFRALSATMASVFADARAYKLGETHLVNLILIASNMPMEDISYPAVPRDGVILTDDLNPIEIFFEQARGGY